MGDISLFSNNNIIFIFFLDLFDRIFLLGFLSYFLFSKHSLDRHIIDRSKYACWFAREISELYKDIFFLSCIKRLSIKIFEKGKFLIKSFSIVVLEIRIEDESSFLYEETSFFPIDKLTNVITSFRSLDEGKPCWIWFSMSISHDLNTFPIMKNIIKRYDLSIYLCNSELISDFGMYSISKINRCCSFWKCYNISFWSENKYLIREDIHSHLTHKFSPFESILDDFLYCLDPIAIL